MKKDKSKKDKIKQGNLRDFDLLYDTLLSGGTYSDYRSELLDRSMPQEVPLVITEDDILAAWILGKDEESELYARGGHIAQFGPDSNWYAKGKFDSTKGAFQGAGNSIISGLGIASTLGGWAGDFVNSNNEREDANEKINANLRDISSQTFGVGDTGYLASQYNGIQRALHTSAEDNGAYSTSEGIMNLGKDAMTGAMTGLSVGGPWGALIGGAAGLGKAAVLWATNNSKAEEQARINNLLADIANNQTDIRFGDTVSNSNKLYLYNQLSQPYMAACGGKMKNRLASGGYINSHYDYITDPLVKVEAGGTHQKNPNEGVLTSIAPDGQPNLVEEGETIINNGQEDAYVFSDRIVADDEILKSHLLPNKFAGKTYADISKELDKIIAEHKNDEISKRTFDEMISRLQQAQEDQKFQEKQEEVEKFLGGLTDEQKEQLEQTMVEETQAEQQAAEEQAIAEQQAQELAAQEQQVQPEQVPEQVAMEQPEEQIVPSRYDQMMSRALFADAANLGMFQLGGFEKTAADTYFYTTHPKIAFDKAKREYKKQDLQLKKTPYGLIVSSPIPSITDVYENIKDKIDDYKALKSIERLVDYETDRLYERLPKKHVSDYIFDLINNLTGYPTISDNKKSKGGHINLPGGKLDLSRYESVKALYDLAYNNRYGSNRSYYNYPGFTDDYIQQLQAIDKFNSEDSFKLLYPDLYPYLNPKVTVPFVNTNNEQSSYTPNLFYGIENWNSNNRSNNSVQKQRSLNDASNYASDIFYKPLFGTTNVESDLQENPISNVPKRSISTGNSSTKLRNGETNISQPIAPIVESRTVEVYSNPHRPDYSIFGQYIPGLTPYEVDGNLLGYTDPFGKFVPIGGEKDWDLSTGVTTTKNNTNAETKSTVVEEPEKNNNTGSTTDYSTWLRYAPAIGSGIQYLSDLFGVTNRNDFSNADMYLRSIKNIPSVGFTPLGNYMTYSPLDETYQQNVARSQYNAARRAIQNNASGNASAALAAMDSLNGNINNTFGDLALLAREYNDKQREAVEQFNANIARINSMMSLSAQEKNQAIAAEKARLTYNLANMRESIQNMNDAAKSANENTFYNNLGAIGKENFNMQMVRTNPAFYYTIMSDGSIVYKNGFYDLNKGDQDFITADAEKALKEQLKKNSEDALKKSDDMSSLMSNPLIGRYLSRPGFWNGYQYTGGLTNNRR